MASITKRPSGKYAVQFFWKHKYQSRITLSTKNRREAERVADYIQELIDSKKNGTDCSESKRWLTKLHNTDSKTYQKLVEHGLAEEIGEPKTIEELFRLFIAQGDRKKTTIDLYRHAMNPVFDFFGENRQVASITTEDASLFYVEMKTTPMNKHTKIPTIYSPATVSGNVSKIKAVFNFAEQLGWVRRSPFRFLKKGSQHNPEKWSYISQNVVRSALELASNPKWKAIVALGRFVGCRGASEIYSLTWDRINFDEKTIVIHTPKKEAFRNVERIVPMCDIVRESLEGLREFNSEQKRLFPGMSSDSSFGTITEKCLQLVGVDIPPEPWYNLRRSFCSDVMESGVDPKVYEDICGHSFQVGMQHYQILHPDRKQKGMDRVREMFDKGK